MAEWFPKRRLGDLPAEAARRWGKREALCFQGRRWTFSELDAEVDRAARGLIAAGLRAGEKVGLWITNRPEFLFAFFAVLKAGGVAVPFNTRYRTTDIAYALAGANCSMLIAVGRSGPIDYCGMLGEVFSGDNVESAGALALRDFPELKRVFFIGEDKLPNTESWDALLELGDRVAAATLCERAGQVDPDGLAMIIYTSGTTGSPKGVMHSHICIRNCTERAAMWGHSLTDVFLNYVPLFHMFGLSDIALMSLLTGARQVLMDVFDGKEALRLIEQEGVTITLGFDTHFTDMLNAQRASPRNLGSLRLCFLPSGVATTHPVARRVNTEFCPTVSGFGMSEVWCSVLATSLRATEEQRCCTSGYPMPGIEARIVDPETDEEAPFDTPGEIRIRGYTVMLGYYRNEEATAATFDRDGWLRTGDQGIIRADGHLQLLGRYKEMLKVGGENVSTVGVELELIELVPGIAQVAVVGYPDARLHEVAVAYIVKKPDAELTVQDVIERCRGKIAGFKIPRHVLFVESLPMTASGKVQRSVLKERALQDFKMSAVSGRS